jgi:hypothetical protein
VTTQIARPPWRNAWASTTFCRGHPEDKLPGGRCTPGAAVVATHQRCAGARAIGRLAGHGAGRLVARSQADAVIVSNRPTDLVLARRVSTRTMRIVRQNPVWAALYNAARIRWRWLAGCRPGQPDLAWLAVRCW